MSTKRRIYLSPPHMGGDELPLVQEAFESNWLAPLGPHVRAFEEEMGARIGRHAVALSAGTAAIHIGLRLLGVQAGDEVFCPSLTFVASVNPVLYLGARPVLIDSERDTWNLCPATLEEALESRARAGRLPRAVVVVHLYGQPAKMELISSICERFGVALLEDAAEALGATYRGTPAGALAPVSAFSFNGNKIITTSGGGMLMTKTPEDAARARHWATQAREPGVEYNHAELGYNYRMSNVLAAMGRGQLRVLDQRVERRRAIFGEYQRGLADLEWLTPMPEHPDGRSSRWLSVFLVAPDAPVTRDDLIRALQEDDIEARPVWKPMHLQPLYEDAEMFGGAVASDLYGRGICLPSGSQMTADDLGRVIHVIRGGAAS